MAQPTIQDQIAQVAGGQAALNTVLGVPKEQIQAMAALGINLYEQGQNRNAESIFQGLIALDQTSFYGYAGMGALALSEERLDEALVYLRKAAELQPKDPTVHANLGETLLRQAKFSDAATEFEKALNLDPDQRDPGANRARAILQGMQVVISEVQRMQGSPGVS